MYYSSEHTFGSPALYKKNHPLTYISTTAGLLIAVDLNPFTPLFLKVLPFRLPFPYFCKRTKLIQMGLFEKFTNFIKCSKSHIYVHVNF